MKNKYNQNIKQRKCMKPQPLNDRVIIEPLDADTTSTGGIIIPDSSQEKPQEGIVVRVGAGQYANNGTLIPMVVKENDKVIYTKYAGTEIKVENVDCLIMRETDILAII